ncbi:beta-ketoacyl-ACP synthase III [Rhizosphaericola mali]|uniref:Beta-ketoacyl-[acyl-carrier-protein] synthase III n=1 Tax=Rhizosphaericola mali TaxID=2545455 RepID=A0A5P2G8R6_9BACT|nr:beta-ketoacyl-ACP synthase III [Rhizosphaericola mali]QES90120.1 ketoacyl-ACP synthase III [Rhizosphaericola mali]
MNKLRATITAVGGYLPEYRLTNKDLEKIVDTTDDWILTRTGIKERRILKDPGLGSSDMAVPAIQEILKKKNLDPLEIDAIICATVTPDMVFPATANIIADKVGAKNAFGFDLEAACSGFLYALTVGASFLESGRCKKIIVVGVDKMSSLVDYTDRTTCILFGDGAGAVLLELSEDETGLQDSILKSDGSGAKHLHMKAGGSLRPATIASVTNKEHFIYQEGPAVFKNAVTDMAEVSAEIMSRNGLTADDITWLAPHQANLRIIEATRERMGIPKEKVMVNITKFGNTTAATIPLCLWEWESKLKKGDNIIMAAFGGGFTWASAWVKWSY